MDGGDEREFVGRRGIVKRGDVFIASMRGPSGKPRPTVVIHADEFIRLDGPVIVCPMTSELADAASIRVRIEPTPSNGLRVDSDVMVDRMAAAFARDLGRHVGQLEPADMTRIEFAAVNVLGLGKAASIIAAGGESP